MNGYINGGFFTGPTGFLGHLLLEFLLQGSPRGELLGSLFLELL